MRTRIFSKMTNSEVEEYLTRNDIIFVPVGVTETHGALPLDAETVLAEAIALKMAEQVDGLVLPNLPYFFPGGTVIAKGTIQMTVKDGMAYLEKIAKSLLNQGFRRQIYITSHGPAYLTVSGMVRDFFDETKVPILYMDVLKAAEAAQFNILDAFHDMSIGAYKVLDRLEDVPLDVPESLSVTYDVDHMIAGMNKNPGNKLGKYAFQSGAVGSFFNEPSDHMVTPQLQTAEQREEYANRGIQAIEELVQALNLPEIVETLRQVDEYTKETSLPKYGGHLPK